MQIVVLWHKTLRGSQVVLWHKTHVKCKLLSYGIRHCVGVKLSYAIRHIKIQIDDCVGVKLSYGISHIKIQIAVLWHKTIYSCVSELFLCISVLLDCSGARTQLDLYFD